MLGLVGLKPSAAAYCASKGAVVLLTKQIAVEYGKDKIHCNALCPGCGYLSLSNLLCSLDLPLSLWIVKKQLMTDQISKRL